MSIGMTIGIRRRKNSIFILQNSCVEYESSASV